MDDRNDDWFRRRTSRWQDWLAEWLLAVKQQLGVTVSVVIPARNEQRTVGSVVGAVVHSLMATVPLVDEQVQLVKGFYTRVRTESDGSMSTEGGRVTELVVRPLISLWWPELAGVVQPLAGEWAARRTLLESLSIPVGYGVELATRMDTVFRHGLNAVAQVDLGSRAHRHQANHDLPPAATVRRP
jgi:hypothetical protein